MVHGGARGVKTWSEILCHSDFCTPPEPKHEVGKFENHILYYQTAYQQHFLSSGAVNWWSIFLSHNCDGRQPLSQY
jgi:hypothetical protein